MSVPKPNSMSELDNACSVIFDNTLYSYSPQGFLSLPLQDSAKWTSLESGVSVEGAVCAGKKLDDPEQASLLVVGGYSDKPDYTGLQEYKFSTGKWQTLKPANSPAKNRCGHGAVYNAASDTIVMFSGRGNSPDAAPVPSSETWKIQVSEPWGVTTAHPPASGRAGTTHPMMGPWGAGSDVALVSGPADDGTVWLMNSNLQAPNSEWRNVGQIKESWDPASASIRATMVHGSDGSMDLLKFDLSRSPNTLERIPVPGAGSRRDLILRDLPEYNSTNAPAATRNGASIAQDHNGMVVISGGNAEDPVAIFNTEKNSWVDAAQLLGHGSQKILATSSSATTTSTSASSSTSTTISST